MSRQVSGLDLPASPSADQLLVIQQYLDQQNKIQSLTGYGTQNYYQDRLEVIGKKLIIFKHKQKKKDTWYMRFYAGDKKYKVLSLGTTDKDVAVQKSLDRWRVLQNQIDAGGQVFESSTNDALDDYLKFMSTLLDTGQIKRHTLQGKKSTLKKLRTFLEPYPNPSAIPPMILDQYIAWRRTKNWDKSHHKNNPNPPSDLTINKELTDFKGFFDWCRKNRKFVYEIEYPFLKIDWNKSVEKNPSFDLEDWLKIIEYSRDWVMKTENRKEYGIFYRKIFIEFLKILANSGLRPHEALKLKWCDIGLKVKNETEYKIVSNSARESDFASRENEWREPGTDDNEEWSIDARLEAPGRMKISREQTIAHVQVSPDTKTGRRLVICPAGDFFKRVRRYYKDLEGRSPSTNDFVFRNIGTSHSKADHFVGKPLSDTYFRKIWYELIGDIGVDREVFFQKNYTLYSCRSFYINQRLELGIAPNIVAKLVGHSIKTMERHYENIELKRLEPELVKLKRAQLDNAGFKTFDLD